MINMANFITLLYQIHLRTQITLMRLHLLILEISLLKDKLYVLFQVSEPFPDFDFNLIKNKYDSNIDSCYVSLGFSSTLNLLKNKGLLTEDAMNILNTYIFLHGKS